MNPQQPLAEVVVDELVRLGVREVVLAPGSRSAPLAYALHDADSAGRLRLHVRVDERSAAFLALGLAKATGIPAPVVTTSGTAVANLAPAVLEAHESGVPMLLLTADRPPELRGTRANQTTDQLAFFGRNVRWFHDLGVPEARPGAAWRTAIDRAVAAATGATGGDPGPVHVNVPLRDPLVPDLRSTHPQGHEGRETHEAHAASDGHDDLEPGAWVRSLAGRTDGSPWTSIPRRTASWGSPPLREIPRTLVVLGDAPTPLLATAVEWAARRCHPVIGEPFGPASCGRVVGRLPHGVRLAGYAEEAELRPDRIVVVGRLTLSRSLARLLRLPDVRVDLVTGDRRWADPGHVVTAVHDPGAFGAAHLHLGADLAGTSAPEHTTRTSAGGADEHPSQTTSGAATAAATEGRDPADSSAGLHDADPQGATLGGSDGSPRGGSVSEEAQAHRAAWTRAAAEISAEIEASLRWPSGPALASTLLDAVPEGAVVFLGSSNGVRHVDLVRGLHGSDHAEVVASRGLAGIDGCVSTAAGIALGSGRPTYALLGDLTFLHDANGLLIGPDEPVPDLTIVVGNDDGGAIFGDLEYGRAEVREALPGSYERLFRTPTATRLDALCTAHGVRHVLARSPEALAAVLAERPSGLTVVEVPLPAA